MPGFTPDEMRKVVDQALTNGTEEVTVTLMLGELFLQHALLQSYGLNLVDEDRFIPLMERSAARVKSRGGK
jgi:hypothetical protein